MHRSSLLVSVAFCQVAAVIGLSAVPTMGATLSVTSWFPPLSSSLSGLNPCNFVAPTCASPSAKTSGTIEMWLGSDTSNSVTYSFAMVGRDPTVKQSGNADISTKIVPIKITATPSYVFDPENNDACSPKRTPALNMVQTSPIFTQNNLSVNGVPLGKGQFVSQFQRANFWAYTQPKATNPATVNPGYQVLLSQVLTNALENAKHTIALVPPGTTGSTTLPYTLPGTVQTDSTWCNPVAMIEVNALDGLLQNQIIPALKGSSNVVPTDLIIFLFANVVMYDTDPANCCVLGYHNAYLSTTTGGTANKLQTYVVANYDSTLSGSFTGAFPNAPDLVGLSGVLADWMDNPTTLNQTPNWFGGPIPSSACANLLEPSVPTAPPPIYPIKAPKFTYHVQDLAFKAWFYNDPIGPTSLQQYSLFGNLTLSGGAAHCP